MADITNPVLLDSTGQDIAAAIREIAHGGGAGGGSIFNITTDSKNLKGGTVVISDGTATQTATMPSSGTLQFDGVTLVGELTITITNGEYSGSSTETVTYFGVYDVTVSEATQCEDAVFAFHYSENDSDPDSVTYPEGYDNSNFTTPFSMNLSTEVPNYGDWDPNGENKDKVAWLFPKPCMLKFNGTVDYYLKESDETKKIDGTASDVNDINYDGNAMNEWGQLGRKIYWKLVPDQGGGGFTFVVANYESDQYMKPWNHYDSNGEVNDHFYTAKYNGKSDTVRLRSISCDEYALTGQTPQYEIDLAEANNPDSNTKIWYTDVYADWLLETMLYCLLSKSTGIQSKYGFGCVSSSNGVKIGSMDGKGMFFGSSDKTKGVKIFGRENPYGNVYRRLAGCISDNGNVKIKLTYGKEDGSTVDGYNLTGNGYISQGTAGTSGGTKTGFINKMNITDRGLTPKEINGSDSTYYCDNCFVNHTVLGYACIGGERDRDLYCGPFFFNLMNNNTYAGGVNASLSCKPLKTPTGGNS